MKIKLTVEVYAEWCDEDLGDPKEGDPLHERVVASVEEAVENALHRVQGDGFSHDMEDLLSLNVLSVEASE